MKELIYNEFTGEFERLSSYSISLQELSDDTSFYYIEGFPSPFPLWEIKMMHLPNGIKIRKINECVWFILKNR